MCNSTDSELGKLNLNALMLTQQAIKENPLKAKQTFGIDDEQIGFIESLTPTSLQMLSSGNIFLFNLRFKGPSLRHLRDFLSGDQLALAHATIRDSGVK